MASSTDFIPSREADLVTFSANFSTKITADPTEYALTAPQAVAYAALHGDFTEAYTAANEPDTRSPTSIVTKNLAKEALIENLRLLAGIVQRAPGTTNEQRSELGLTLRDPEGTPILPPADAPKVDIISAIGNTVRVRLRDAVNPSRRGKPEGVNGAALFSFVGATPPGTEAEWTFEGNTARTVVDVTFPESTPAGAKVWFTAFWFNPRKQSGPAAAPVTTNLPGGAAMAA